MNNRSVTFNFTPYKNSMIDFLQTIHPHLSIIDVNVHLLSREILKVTIINPNCCTSAQFHVRYVKLTKEIHHIVPATTHNEQALTEEQKKALATSIGYQLHKYVNQKVLIANPRTNEIEFLELGNKSIFKVYGESSEDPNKIIINTYNW